MVPRFISEYSENYKKSVFLHSLRLAHQSKSLKKIGILTHWWHVAFPQTHTQRQPWPQPGADQVKPTNSFEIKAGSDFTVDSQGECGLNGDSASLLIVTVLCCGLLLDSFWMQFHPWRAAEICHNNLDRGRKGLVSATSRSKLKCCTYTGVAVLNQSQIHPTVRGYPTVHLLKYRVLLRAHK